MRSIGGDGTTQLRAAGWEVLIVPLLRDPDPKRARTPQERTRRALWTKFNYWALTGYDTLAAIDADVLPLRNADWLLRDFDTHHDGAHGDRSSQRPSAPRDTGRVAAYSEVALPRWNSGIMQLTPSFCTLARLLRNATLPPDPRTLDRESYLGDQPVLNTAFIGRVTELSKAVAAEDHSDRRFHRAATSLSRSFCGGPSGVSPIPELPGNRSVWSFVHLFGRKPYQCTPRGADCNDKFSCPRGVAAFWNEFYAMPKSMQEACVRFGASP